MTTGLSAVMGMIRLGGDVTMAGFDFFESGLHNIDEEWDTSGNHNLNKERDIVKMLSLYGMVKII